MVVKCLSICFLQVIVWFVMHTSPFAFPESYYTTLPARLYLRCKPACIRITMKHKLYLQMQLLLNISYQIYS